MDSNLNCPDEARSAPLPRRRENAHVLPLLISVAGGVLGFCLRLYMNAHCFEPSGLLHRGCALHVLLVLLSILIPVSLIVLCRRLDPESRFQWNYGPSLPGALGCFAAAVCIFIYSLGGAFALGDAFHRIIAILGLLAAPCLVFWGVSRLTGKRCPFLFPLVICLYFALRLVCEFRAWSTDPVIEDYCFALLSSVAAMLAGYHLAGFSIERASRRRSLFFSLTAVYFTLVALADKNELLFYGGVAVWLFSVLPWPRNPRPRRRPGGVVAPEGSQEI